MRRHIPVLVFLSVALMAPAGKFTYYVNPFIGTGAVEGGLSGNNYPGATVPFGMVQLSPDTHVAPDWYNASGYAGNDDCGEMSAWYVFSALGFYPVNPASGEYSLGTPLFDSCSLHLPSGRTFTITASRKSTDRHLVKSVQLNGKRVDGHTVTYADIMNGGHLHFNM